MSPSTRRREQLPAINRNAARDQSELPPAIIGIRSNALKRFASVLDTLPNGYIFDGEIVALDDDGRPMFNDLMFGRREPVFVPFDVLVADGENVTALPLKDRKASLTQIVRRHRLQKLDCVIGEGKAAF